MGDPILRDALTVIQNGSRQGRAYRGWAWRAFALLLGMIGLYLAIIGGQLVLLGGSLYYVLTGVVVLACAVLVWRGDLRAGLLYGLMLLGTLAWSLWETGLEPWQLVARLVAPLVLGIPFAASAIWRRGGAGMVALAATVLLAVVFGSIMYASSWSPEPGETGYKLAEGGTADQTGGDWLAFGRSNGGTRFAPFTQVDQSNVGDLAVAWTYRSGSKFGENTPLKIGDSLYLCTGENIVLSLDAETGRERWRYDPVIRKTAYGRWCRALAYHELAYAGGDRECRQSLFMATRDARLIAIDARTGKPCSSFGEGGTIDMTTGMGGDPEGYLYASSPPIVVGDAVIMGNAVYDGQSNSEPSGVVRAFDTATGQFLWAFDAANPDVQTEPGPGEHYTRSSADVWSVMSADSELGLVFLPTGNPTPDYYGGTRTPAMDKYAASTVALDVKTGKVVWAFQTVHHDIWDYDVPSQPVLVDFPTAQGKVKAVLQPTKRGELFVLDRKTGKPLVTVEEKPTPQGGIAPGEWLSPTQPFSTGIASLLDDDLTEADMWGMTPLDQLWCRVKFKQARYEGTMTPIGLEPSVRLPGSSGVYNWGSVSVDEDRGIIVAPTLHLANYDFLIPRDDPRARQFDKRTEAGHPEIGPGAGGPQRGTPYAVSNAPFFSPLAAPCTEPPFGRVAAIDLKTRKVLWNKPVGTARKSGPFGMQLGLPLPMGVPVSGSMVVTRGGLTFYGAAQDGYLRAYATRTGAELWRSSLPVGTESSPMTYIAPESGRQMVVISVGGAVGSAESGDYVVAYALPRKDQK